MQTIQLNSNQNFWFTVKNFLNTLKHKLKQSRCYMKVTEVTNFPKYFSNLRQKVKNKVFFLF